MLKCKLGLLALLVIMFTVPSLASAKPDRLQIIHSPAIGGEIYTCYTSNIGGDEPILVTATLLNPVGEIIRQRQYSNNPGNTHETDFIADEPNGRCTVEWFGQPEDLIGSFCASKSDGTGKACLHMQ